MSGLALAGRYAKALFALAQKNKCSDKVEGDLLQLMKVVGSSGDLYGVLHNPLISKRNIESLLAEVLGKCAANKLTINFINVLVENGRIKYLLEVVDFYKNLMMQSRGEHAAYITVASALSDGQIADIEVALAAASGKKIKAIVSVDDEILGGIVVRIGSKMLDASVAYQIDKFAELSRKAVMNLN